MKKKKLPKCVYLRKDGRYEGRFMYHGESYNIYGNTPQTVKKQLEDLRYEVRHSMYQKALKMTVDQYFREWIDIYKKPNIKKSTLDVKYRYYESYIKKYIGKKYLIDVIPKDIQKVYNEMAAGGYSDCTISCVRCIMHEMFTQAYKEKLIQENPVSFATVAKGIPKETRRALTKKEQELFIMYAKKYDKSYYSFFLLALCTGMRRGEMLGLRWSDVDFKKRVIHITGTLSRALSAEPYRTAPKTKLSERDIPMLNCVYKLLQAQRYEQLQMKKQAGGAWQPKPGLEDLVFTGKNGEPKSEATLRRHMVSIIKRIRADGYEMENFCFHSLRHTFATRAIEGGMRPQTLKVIMGHSSLQMTMDIYSHVMDDTKAEEMKMISNMF